MVPFGSINPTKYNLSIPLLILCQSRYLYRDFLLVSTFMCICCRIASSCLYNLFRIDEELKLSPILQTIKTLGVPSNKLAENIPFLRLKVDGKKVEGNFLQP